MIGEWFLGHKKFVVTACIILVVGIIVLTIFFMPDKGINDQNSPDDVFNIAVTEVYDVDPTWPYLIICFNDTPKAGSVAVDTSGSFELKTMSYNDECVDFLINNWDGIGSAGEYDIYVSVVGQNDTRLDREKVTVYAIDSLDVNSEAGTMQNEAANRNSDSGP